MLSKYHRHHRSRSLAVLALYTSARIEEVVLAEETPRRR
jgi:hypothetical protein